MKRAEPASTLAFSGSSGSRGPSAGRWGSAPSARLCGSCGRARRLTASEPGAAGSEIEVTEAVGSVP